MSKETSPRKPRYPGGHLSVEAALDLGRGVIPLTGDTRLQEHVDACADCRAKVNRFNKFATFARRDQSLTPPAGSMARVQALLSPVPRVSALTKIKAALRYDSAWFPLPLGVRGAAVPEQVVYEAEGVAVDLRVTQERARNMVIVGQLAHAGNPERRLADLPVLLIDGDEVKVRALSNAWGEFHLEHPRRDHLRLEVGLPGGRVIRIPIKSKRKPS